MIKETEISVSDELEDFYDDVRNSQKRLRLLLNWPANQDLTVSTPKMKFEPPKRKFKPKVKRTIKRSRNDRRTGRSTF